MAFALIFVGLLLVISAVRGTTSQLAALVQSDFVGQGNFVWWVAVIMAIGAIGYIGPLRTLSKAFLALVIVVLVLTKGNPQMPAGGLFRQLYDELNKATATAPAVPTAAAPAAPTAAAPSLPVSGQGQTPVSSLPALPDLVSI
jgi:hypothetical protein